VPSVLGHGLLRAGAVMKWVTWLKYERNRGAWARFHFEGKLYQRSFSGLPKRVAMARAKAWVQAELKRLGKPNNLHRRFRSSYSRKTSNLPLGISISKKHGTLFVNAYASLIAWQQTRRSWSIPKWGRDVAIRMALTQREQWMDERERLSLRGKNENK
jgi:hypothetical protein